SRCEAGRRCPSTQQLSRRVRRRFASDIVASAAREETMSTTNAPSGWGVLQPPADTDVDLGGRRAALENEQELAAAQRMLERREDRLARIAMLQRPGGMQRADDPERIARRLDRIRASTAESELDLSGRELERVINAPDFLDVRFLEAGTAAARAVG